MKKLRILLIACSILLVSSFKSLADGSPPDKPRIPIGPIPIPPAPPKQ